MLQLLLLVPLASSEIPQDSPEHANHYKSEPVSSGDVTASASSAWARQQEAKLRVKFANGSDDYLLSRKDGARSTMGSGEHQSSNKTAYEVIDPEDDGSHTYVFKDESGQLHEQAMTARLDGIYLAPTDGPPVEAEPFTLPLSANEVEAGGFTCRSKGKIKQETQETKAKFECTFDGEDGTVGLVESQSISVAIPDGQAFANESGKEAKLLLPGEKTSFEVKTTVIKPKPHGVDMQFTKLTLLWNDALRAITAEPVELEDWAFTLDEALTAEKNE